MDPVGERAENHKAGDLSEARAHRHRSGERMADDSTEVIAERAGNHKAVDFSEARAQRKIW